MTLLELDPLQLTAAALWNSRKQRRYKRPEILKSVARSNEQDDSHPRLRQILLELEVTISGYENFKPRVSRNAK
jgi:hypothetical protein